MSVYGIRSLRIVGSLIAAAFGVIGILGFAGAAEAKPVVKVKKNEITFGQAVTLNGKVGKDASKVLIVARPFPYKTGQVVKQVKPRKDGTFSTRVRPEFNTRYQVRAEPDGELSRTVQVWVAARTTFRVMTPRAGVAWILANLWYSPRGKGTAGFNGSNVRIYFAKNSEPRFRRIGTTKVRKVGPGHYRLKERLTIPKRGRYRFYVTVCFNTSPGKDDGSGKPQAAKCPKKGFSKKSKAWYNPFR